jgi:23S rRNA (adenine-N6)-dimethyltransferase
VAAAPVEPGDLVVDLGAGTGPLTGWLVRRGARVVAVELHAGRAAALRQRFADAPVVVVQADVTRLHLPRRPFRVVANPPFAVSVAILKRLFGTERPLLSADLVLPHHLAVRWSNGRGATMSRWPRDVVALLGPRVPAHAFRPPPPSPVSVLQLRRVSQVIGRAPGSRRRAPRTGSPSPVR